MRAGDLNRRVLIREWQDVPNNAFAVDQVFTAGVMVWAFMRPVGAALFYGTEQIQTGITHQFFVRRTSVHNEATLTALFVVEHRGLRYRIKRVANYDDADVFMQLDVEQLGPAT